MGWSSKIDRGYFVKNGEICSVAKTTKRTKSFSQCVDTDTRELCHHLVECHQFSPKNTSSVSWLEGEHLNCFEL